VADLRSRTAPAEAIPEGDASCEAGLKRTATFEAVYGPLGARLLADEAFDGALGALDKIDRDTEGLAELVRSVRRGSTRPVREREHDAPPKTEGDGLQSRSGTRSRGSELVIESRTDVLAP
jgi:hypothetical protein